MTAEVGGPAELGGKPLAIIYTEKWSILIAFTRMRQG